MSLAFPEVLYTFGLLLYASLIIGFFIIVIAIWRGMKAQERMAASLERIEEAIGRGPGRV